MQLLSSCRFVCNRQIWRIEANKISPGTFLPWDLDQRSWQHLSLCSDWTSLVSIADSGKVGLSRSQSYPLPGLQKTLILSHCVQQGMLQSVSVRQMVSEVHEPARYVRVSVKAPAPVCLFVTQLGLTARWSTCEEIGHHLSFAFDCDHTSVFQCVVIGAQDLVQVCSHLETEGGKGQ